MGARRQAAAVIAHCQRQPALFEVQLDHDLARVRLALHVGQRFLQHAEDRGRAVEGFPIFGGLLLVAIVTGRHDITDPLAYWLVVARIAQSTVHLMSLSVLAVNVGFTFFVVQIVIAVSWVRSLVFV